MQASLYPVNLPGMKAHARDRCRPRHPERTALYRLFERHFDDYAREYDLWIDV